MTRKKDPRLRLAPREQMPSRGNSEVILQGDANTAEETKVQDGRISSRSVEIHEREDGKGPNYGGGLVYEVFVPFCTHKPVLIPPKPTPPPKPLTPSRNVHAAIESHMNAGIPAAIDTA